jgi:hypothetical protein
VIVIHPAFETADHAHPLETVTTICPAPPLESTDTDVGVTNGEQVGADGGAGGAGVTGGSGADVGGSAGGGVGSGVELTGGVDAGGVGVTGGVDAAGAAPACTTVTDVPLIDTAAMRGPLDGFGDAVTVTAPSPCPVEGLTCSHDASTLALQRQSRAAVIGTLTRSPFAASAC